jgi:signal peptidase I
MRPGIEPGDWLLVDPTTNRWPRRGSIVLVREPGSDLLVLKRVAGRPGDTVRLGTSEGAVPLGPDEAWLLGDARDLSIDSRRYGPVSVDRLVGRAWFRYGPAGRPFGPLAGVPRPLSRPAGPTRR